MAGQRRSGRREKLAQRAAPPVINPCPPGQIGGQYQPLTEPECQAIFDMALRLLAELGMGEVPGYLADLLISKGGRAKGERVLLPPRTSLSGHIQPLLLHDFRSSTSEFPKAAKPEKPMLDQ